MDERALQEVVDILSSIDGFTIRVGQPLNLFELRGWLRKLVKRYPDKDFIEVAERYETWAMSKGAHYGPGVFRKILSNTDIKSYDAARYSARFGAAPISVEEQLRQKQAARDEELRRMGAHN